MKRGTLTHPKTLDLAARLDITPSHAYGLLQALLDWAYQYTPCGDIGRYSNKVIAEGIYWNGDPDHLIHAFIDSGWLDLTFDPNDPDHDLDHDPDRRCRFVIHDLADHADQQWKRRVGKLGQEFVQGISAKQLKAKRPVNGSTKSASENLADASGDLAKASEELAKTRNDPTPPVPVPVPVPEPDTDHREDRKLSLARDRFERFWEAYPRKIAKQAAWAKWEKLKPTAELLKQILAAVEAQKQSDQWRRDNGQFIPHPATWLNQGRWEDQVQTPLPPPPKPPSSEDEKLRRKMGLALD